jgi:Leucine-rich repeat (LRR) protein
MSTGVGSPEDTYGIVCEPQAGTDLDPHYVQPWARQKRKPVTLLNPNDRTNLSATCYGYTAQPGDNAASLADAFLVDLRLFARDNVDVWTLTTVTDVFEGNTTAELQTIVDTVKSVKLPGAIEPYFVCNKTDGSSVRCDSASGFGACLGINCTFFYSEQDVRIDPAGKLLRVCNISSAPGQFEKVAYFQDPKVSQPRALRAMLDILNQPKVGPVPNNYCSATEWQKFNGPAGKAPTFTDRWVKSCDAAGYVTELDISITRIEDIAQDIGTRMLNALLTLEKLERVYLVVKGGELPPQLGALKTMNSLKISYECMSGPLPPNWGRDWANIQYMSITQYPSIDGSSEDVGCGITGQLPVVWGSQMRPMLVLDLSGNALTGPLPPDYDGLKSMQELYLQNNRFTNKIPREWKILRSLTKLDLSGNLLTGAVPLEFDLMVYQLQELHLDDNRGMTGCVPLGAFTTLTYSNTGITGLCSATRLSIEAGQVQTVNKLLSPLLNADGNWTDVVKQFINRNGALYLKDWISNGQFNGLIPANNARGTLTMALTIIDGTTYITSVRCTGGGLDLSVLPAFIKGLPRLDTFSCIDCTFIAANSTASSLPRSLPDFVHPYFKTLTLGRSRIIGPLPTSWGAMQSLTKLELYNNSLTGLLPEQLGNMPSLQSLNVAYNRLRGSLPKAWGGASLPADFQLEATGNTGLTGSVPSTWARFTGYIKLEKTGIKGCVPDQLVYSVYKDDPPLIDMEGAPPNDPCSALAGNPYYKQVVTLVVMRGMLDPNGTALASWGNSSEFVMVPKPGEFAR